METITTTEREHLIEGLRRLADFLAVTPQIELSPQIYNVYVESREELAAIARLGSWQKHYVGDYFVLRKSFAGVTLDVYTNRQSVCRAVVTGQRVVPAQPAQPERVEDVVEWVCDDAVLLVPPSLPDFATPLQTDEQRPGNESETIF